MFKKLKLLCAFVFLGHFAVEAGHPIYIMLTHARATATALEKVFRTREDMQVLHAPFLYPYLIKKYGPGTVFTNNLPDMTVTFDSVKDDLFALAEKSPVFLKESGYLLIDYLRENPDFVKNPQVKFAFLIRDPAKSIISFYRKMPTVTESIIGHKALWDLYEMLKDQLDYTPVVIDSDLLLKDPLKVLNTLGESWNLKFDQKNLEWKKEFAKDWHVKNWYVDVGESTKLGGPTPDIQRLEDGTPVYEEVTNDTDRERLRGFYKSQIVYYQKLLPYAIK